MSNFPLSGMRVVELNERGSASYAGKLLHRLGAELIKVEGPTGDPLRRNGSPRHDSGGKSTTAAFDYFNDGKTVNIVADPAMLREQVAAADAFVLDLELSRYPAWGLDPAKLDTLSTKVVCAVSPFGLTGPYAHYRATDAVVSAYGGMSIGIGDPNREPLNMPMLQSAIQGGLLASISIIGALTGKRDSQAVIDISESDVWATLHAGTTMGSFFFSNKMRRRAGRRLLGQPYPHQLFECKDGLIAVQASERHQFDQLVKMVDSPDFMTDRRFGTRMQMNNQHADELDALLAPWFMARTRAEIFKVCLAFGIPAAPVQSLDEARKHPALIARDSFESYRGATGKRVTVPRMPMRFANAEIRPTADVPAQVGDKNA